MTMSKSSLKSSQLTTRHLSNPHKHWVYLSSDFIVGKSYRFIYNSAYLCICVFFNVSFMFPIYKSTQIFISSRKSVARWSHSRNLYNTRLNLLLFIKIIFKIDKFRTLQIICGFCVNIHCRFSIRMS